MSARLISVSKPVDEFAGEANVDTAQELIAYCARVSNPANQNNKETADKLIRYLVKHKHWSPFEMASACIEIVSTRDIVRQLLRHRSFSFQEFSQRYADPTAAGTGLEFQIREARWQDLKNRQNSIRPEEDDIEKKYIALQWERKQKELIDWVDAQYRWAIENGIAKEQARVILPEGLTSSRVYVNGTIRSWIHYIDVRTEAGTQLEHRQLAFECARAIAEIFPGIEEYNHKD